MFVNLKSNLALLYNKGHNLLTSAFPPNNVKIFKFSIKNNEFHFQAELVSFQTELITFKQNL